MYLTNLGKYSYASTFRPAKLANLHFQFNPEKDLQLLVLHGIMGSKNNFRSVIKNHEISSHLKDGHLLDLRNHGDSEHIDTMSFEELALDIKNYIDIHKLNNIVLLGHSFGGRNIFGYLQHQNQHALNHIKGVIIADILPTPLKSDTKDLLLKMNQIDLNQRFYKDLKKDIEQTAGSQESGKEISGLILTNIISKNLQLNCKSFSIRKYIIFLQDNDRQDFRWKINLQTLVDTFDYNINYNFKSDWRGPAQVICGADSQYVNEGDRQVFRQVFPYIDTIKHIHFIPQCGHWVHAQKPRDFIRLVGKFIQSL